MPAVLRNNAVSTSVRGADIGRSGGRGAAVRQGGPVKRKVRYPSDPAAELMPAAEFLGLEPDFNAVLEDFAESPFNPARRRVLGRLMGMFAMDYQGAGPEERRFLRRLLAARNAREGYVANRALHLCTVPHVIRRTLALGVAEARFAAGASSGFLGAVQARIAATTFKLLGPRGRRAVWDLLTAAGHDAEHRPLLGADRVVERALILKAVAARRDRLGPWRAGGEAALTAVAEFAAHIRGIGRDDLAARTTLLPGDPKRLAAGLAVRSDGGERAGYLARGDVDPVFAWQENGARAERQVGAAPPASDEDAMGELDENPLLARPRLHQALAEARAASDSPLPVPQREALAEYLGGRRLSARKLTLKDEALQVLAGRAFDVAGGAAVEAIRQDAQGIYRFDAARALGDLLSRYTGATYVRRLFNDQLTAGADPLLQITTALSRGMPVPITVNELKHPVCRAFLAVAHDSANPLVELQLREFEQLTRITVSGRELLAAVLPESLGRRARADAFLAPAALDLLAPPFGIPFPALGIEDRL